MAITLDGTNGITTETGTGDVSVGDDLIFTGTGNRITGDFSNATIANRVMFQTSMANSQTSIGVLPNGTNTFANINLFGGTDPGNASFAQLVMTGSEARVTSGATGTGTYLPMTFYTNNSERMRIDTSGNLLFNSGYGSVATAFGCRAWVNFDGTTNVAGNCTIRASGNVSTVADNGTGDYTVNFTTAMPDVNYATTVGFNNQVSNDGANLKFASSTAGSVTVQKFENNASVDCTRVFVAIFR